MWRYAYMLPALILQQLEQLPGQDIQSLLLRPKDFEVPWVSYEVFYSVIGRMMQSIVEAMNWQPIFDEIWNNRAHKDYNGSNSKQRDFLRSWNHTRKPEAETTVEKVTDSGVTIGKKVTYDLTDKSEPFEEQIAQTAIKRSSSCVWITSPWRRSPNRLVTQMPVLSANASSKLRSNLRIIRHRREKIEKTSKNF